MGPAAAGKTTLASSAVLAAMMRISAGIRLGKAAYIRSDDCAGSARSSLCGAASPSGSVVRSTRDAVDRAAGDVVAGDRENDAAVGSVAVFDHGPLVPVGKAARVRSGTRPTSEPFERWWHGSLARWFEALDIVVMLDAPDAVLLQRVDERGHWFLGGRSSAWRRRRSSSPDTDGPSTRSWRAPVRTGPTILRFRADEMSVG